MVTRRCGGFALAMTAWRVDEEPPAAETGGTETGGETGTAEPAVAQCGGETIVIAVNPWVGAAANANVAKNIMESEMGCTVTLQEVNESAQFGDGRRRRRCHAEVWPSGHAKDRKTASTRPDRRRRRSARITGNIGWFTPRTRRGEPEFATWEGFEGDTSIFATADRGHGPVPGSGMHHPDEAIIATLGLNLEVVYSGRGRVAGRVDKAY
jgi:hypothetical protein